MLAAKMPWKQGGPSRGPTTLPWLSEPGWGLPEGRPEAQAVRTQSRLGGTHLLADAWAGLHPPPGCVERWGLDCPLAARSPGVRPR